MQGYFNVFHFIALAALALLSVLFMLLSRGEKYKPPTEMRKRISLK